MKNKKVLIAEDDLALLETLAIMLKDRYEIYTARNGEELIKLFKEKRPDLVVTDILMPEIDGVEATKRILEIDPNAIVIGITAYYLSKAKSLLEVGAKEVLEKPFTRKKLIETIEKYLSKSKT
ncbi:MAG: response regulator [Archaeoglobaceae archaeon]